MQSSLRWLLTLGVAGAGACAIAIALHKAWVLPPEWWEPIVLGAAILTGLGLLVGLVRRYDRVRLAARLDRVNDLKDRLGTALEILRKPESQRTEFEQAQLRDAAAHAQKLDHRRAAPWRFPRELIWVAGTAGAAWALTFIHMSAPVEDPAHRAGRTGRRGRRGAGAGPTPRAAAPADRAGTRGEDGPA